jgi:predicted RNase H-like nuclease (RuvC/YqgF family)
LLKDRYTRQIERITELEDIVNDLSIARENLRNTMIKLQHQCQQLSLKVEYIYTHVTNTSPILSNDEKKMFAEIQLINDKIDGLKRSLKTASSKVSIGLCNVPASQGTLSNESKNTIISALKEE